MQRIGSSSVTISSFEYPEFISICCASNHYDVDESVKVSSRASQKASTVFVPHAKLIPYVTILTLMYRFDGRCGFTSLSCI